MRDTILSIAARNVLRNWHRTIITAIVLAVGISFFILFGAILAGMDRLTIDSMIDYSTASVILRTKEYQAEALGTPLDFGFARPESAMGALRAALPSARGFSPRTRFLASASNRVDSLPILAFAVDPEAEARTFALASALEQGTWFGKKGGVVIGSGLAKELGISLGDWLLVSARTMYDTINAAEYEVTGLIGAAAPQASSSGLFMESATARTLLGEELPVTEIAISLPRSPSLDAELAASRKAEAAAESAVPGSEGISVAEAAGDYLAMRNMKSKYSMLMILVVLIIAAVGIVNTVLMSVYSRVREIGVLRAYGMGRKEIRRLFSLEGLLVGFAGSLCALVIAALLVWLLSTKGISLEAMMGKVDMGSIPMSGNLKAEWKAGSFVTGFIFGMLTSWIAALVPARKAARLEVTDALRFV